jgi:hypothetical protein
VGALVTGFIGLMFWRYQKKKEIDRLWEKNVLCKKVKDKLNLDVPDPETGMGFDLQKGMEYLTEEFKKTEGYGHNIDKMTSEELDGLMVYLIPAFTVHQVVKSGWLGRKKTIDIMQLKKVGQLVIQTVQNMKTGTSQKINISSPPPPFLVPLPIPSVSPVFIVTSAPPFIHNEIS